MELLDLTGHSVANRGMKSSCVLVSMGSHLCWVHSGGVVRLLKQFAWPRLREYRFMLLPLVLCGSIFALRVHAWRAFSSQFCSVISSDVIGSPYALLDVQ